MLKFELLFKFLNLKISQNCLGLFKIKNSNLKLKFKQTLRVRIYFVSESCLRYLTIMILKMRLN